MGRRLQHPVHQNNDRTVLQEVRCSAEKWQCGVVRSYAVTKFATWKLNGPPEASKQHRSIPEDPHAHASKRGCYDLQYEQLRPHSFFFDVVQLSIHLVCHVMRMKTRMRNLVPVFWLPPRAHRYGVRYAVARRLGSQVVKMATHTTFISPLEGSRFNPVWSATSQDDYQPYIGAERVEAILPPPPSSILHRDAKHLSFGTSLSRSTYSVPSPCERAPHIDRHRMYATNFCMSADPQPAITVTTHRHYHRPIAVQHPESTKKETKNPLGVRVALLTSESEYAGSFTGSRAGNAAQRDGKCMSHRDPILGKCTMYCVHVGHTYAQLLYNNSPHLP